MLSPEQIAAARRIPPLDYKPPTDPLEVLHQDDFLIVLNKPSGLLSVPGKYENVQDSLELRVKAEYPDALLVHRLDMDTSGIFVMARTKDAQRNLGLQFERRRVEKNYIARVMGHMKDDEGLVDLPLRCDWERRPLQMVCHEHGRPSQTQWDVMSRDETNGMPTTLVSLTPITGRSHQLRVHMAELGHPILGDCFYTPEEGFNAADRLLLHAETLTLYHPRAGEKMTFTQPIKL